MAAAGAKRGPNWRRWSVQVAVSLGVLALLFWMLPGGDILAGIAQIPLLLFLLVVLFFLTAHLFAAAKWWLLIGRTVPFRAAARVHYIGLAANLCLPGLAAGDAARAGLAWRSAEDRSRLAAGSLADRLIDLVALSSVALLGLVFAESADAGLVAALLPTILIVVAAGLWIGPPVLARLWAGFPKLPAQAFVRDATAALAQIGRRPLFLVGMVLLSILIQGALILLALQLARATGVEVTVAEWAFAWAVAKLIVVLPVSLGGLGVREAALAGLLAPFGAAAPAVVAGGLAWQGVLFSAGIVGGLLLATSPRARNKESEV